MRVGVVIVLASFFLLVMNVTAQEDVSKVRYQQDILKRMDKHGEKFDDCFMKLSVDFPDVSTEYLELNEKIGVLTTQNWYYRIINTSFYGQVLHEAFFYMNWGSSQYAISIRYFFNNNTQKFTIPSLYLLCDDYGGATGDFGHVVEGIPGDVAGHSIDDIEICVETPGFLFIPFVLAVVVVLIFYSRYTRGRT